MGRPKNIALKGPEEYWPHWETVLTTQVDVETWLLGPGVWRGQENAAWGMTTNLHRRLGSMADEARQSQIVEEVTAHLADRVPWTRRAGVVHRLALLQHYGAATPLLDVTHNPLVALAFAVKPQGSFDAGAEPDGRLFRFEPSQYESVADDEASSDNWESLTDPKISLRGLPTRPIRLYTPDPLDPRMAAQSGAFLFGRLPDQSYFGTGKPRFPLEPSNESYLSFPEHRLVWSQYVRCHRNSVRGRPPKHSIRTARVIATLKAPLREWLKMQGVTPAVLFPDLQGQASWIDRTW